MVKIQNTPRTFWITFLVISIPISLLALYQAVPQLASQDIAPWRSKWTLVLFAMILNIFLGGFSIWGLARGSFENVLGRIESASLSGFGSAAAIIIIPSAPALFWLIRFKVFGSILPQLFPSLWIFLWLSLIAALALKATTKLSLGISFITLILLQGVIFRIWSIFGVVTDFPFSIEYSETSRFYFASLPFSQSLYGMDLPLSTLHPSRYLLQAIPFLIPNLPLWAHRLWQALLWIILTGTSSWLLARRMKLSSKYLTAILTAWGFVYFLQGVVYYHLQVCVIIILLGFSAKRPYKTLIAVVLASLWAGISRVNWFPVPAMLAITLYLLEVPVSSVMNHPEGLVRTTNTNQENPSTRLRDVLHYLKHPTLWAVAGVSSALLSQVLYVFWSGNANNAKDFGSSFTSNLIWSRLLPNVTYPLGVLPGILIVATPLLIFLFYSLVSNHANWHFIRPLGLFSMLTVLFLGGLVVSTKIGGGADIHNMDAFMVMLAFISSGFFANQVSVEKTGGAWGAIPVWVMILIAFIPVAFSTQGVQKHFSYDKVQTQKDLDTLRTIVEDASKQGGEVLFIGERQFVTFHILNVKLVPEYEVVTLMEMAMSGDQAYMDQFNKDLADHRFAVIVTHKQRVVKKADEPFAEENNVWIDSISRPLLCYYERSITLDSSNTLILTPTQAKENCP